MDPRLTICIVHYNKLEKLQNTISTLAERTDEPYRLKVLNNGYEDEQIRSYLSDLEYRQGAEVLYNEENVGCPPGRHQLLKDIDTEFVMTLDDDMYVEDGWFEAVLDIFETNQDIGVVGIPYRDMRNNELRGGAHVTVDSGVIKTEQIDWATVPTDGPYILVDDVPGGTMVFRQELLEDFTWDPQFFVGMGDLDKSLQIMETDWQQAMMTDVVFKHDVVTNQEYQRIRKDYRERYRSYKKFVDKWDCRYSDRKHLVFNYLFRLPWPVMSAIEKTYKAMEVKKMFSANKR